MIAMAVQDDWVSVAAAAAIAGCSAQYLRRELEEHYDEATRRSSGGRVEGWKANGRAWLVNVASAEALRETLSTRARRHEAQRVAKKKAARKAKKAR
jgi:hypothetical protein